MKATRSIRFRATMVMSALILGVIAAYSAVTYVEIRNSAVVTANERLMGVSQQLAEILEVSVAQLEQRAAAIAQEPEVARYLRGNGTADATLAALARDVSGPNLLGVELRDSAGRRLLSSSDTLPGSDAVPEPSVAALVPLTQASETGQMQMAGDYIVYPAVGRVSDGDRPLGYIIEWRRLANSQQGLRQTQELIGPGARVYLANTTGDVWTDLNSPVPPPQVDPRLASGVTRYQRETGEEAIAAARIVPGSPWTVVVEFPYDLVLEGPGTAMRWLVLAGVMLLLLSAWTAWMLSGRLTGSIKELASAAQSISEGNYSRRTFVHGPDELGTLGLAFNSMAESVADAHRELELKVEELAASQKQTRATGERLEHVTASSRSIIYTLRVMDGTVGLDWISDNVKWLLGYDVDEALVPGWWERNLHKDDRNMLGRSPSRFRLHDSITEEYRFRHSDGGYRWIRDEQRILHENDNIEVIGTLSDITERRNLEAAKESAEAANNAKSYFLSRMSHELRTPMNAILGFAQILELEVEDEADRDCVLQILRGGRHLLQLIDEVLDLARVEAGRMALSVEPVSLTEVLRQSLELVQGIADQRQISLQTEGCDSFVEADQQRLKQVLLNLLSNAIKYNRDGGRVNVMCEEFPAGTTRVSVTDTGRGLSAAAIERLFMPFERFDADQAGIQGTGLGLSLSKGLVEAMGGQIGVDSRPGIGSTFWVDLTTAPRPAPIPAEISSEPLVQPPIGNGVQTILYIEDNVSNLHLVQRLFRRQPNLRIMPAMQGRIGLDLARQHRPDLILLDVHLPDIMGQEVLAELQRDPGLRDIPVIVISADATPKQIGELLAGGARDYLTKPFEVTRLAAAIAEALQSRGKNGGAGREDMDGAADG